MDNGKINIHGKEYKTVAYRVGEFYEQHPNGSIKTKIIDNGDVVIMKALILSEDGKVIGTGHAEEVRGSTNINKTSALENCETSAIGRALAACGFAGTEYASANEVSDAIIQQAVIDIKDEWKNRMLILRGVLPSILAYKEAIADNDYIRAYEAWGELTDDEKAAIYYPAPTQGGILTTKEREALKSNEMTDARNKVINGYEPVIPVKPGTDEIQLG